MEDQMKKYGRYLAWFLAVMMIFSLLPVQAAWAVEDGVQEEENEGCLHPEENIVVDAAVAATCETDGLTEGSHCGLCNAVLAEQVVVEATGHTPEAERRDAVEATEETEGYTGDLYCAVCGKLLEEGEVIPKVEVLPEEEEEPEEVCLHPEESIVIDEAVAATCEEDGLTEGSHCGLCNAVLVEQKVVEATGHTPEEARRNAAEATAESEGYTGDLYCAVCGELLEEGAVIPKTGSEEVSGEEEKEETEEEADEEEPEEDGPRTIEDVIIDIPGEFIDISGEDWPSPEELYLAYFNRLLEPRFRSVRPRRDNLTGNSLDLYDALLPMVTAVASGNEENTIFEIPFTSLGFTLTDGDLVFQETELQLSGSLITPEDEWNENIKTEAVNKIAGMLPDFGSVFDALLADHPYEMYWFGKSGRGGVVSCNFSGQYYGGEWHVKIKVTGKFVDTDNNINRSCGTNYACGFLTASFYRISAYTVDTGLTSGAAGAAGYINEIVDYANRNYSTESDKLTYFKNVICSEVSYDHAAANQGYQHYDTNAWELIYVFDENPNTNVVCEGYSKAFKYLCDRAGLDCITVVGTMDGGTGAGAHMWNIVRLNGENLMVDVTNSDDGSAGSEGGLFLEAYQPHIEYSYPTYAFTISSPYSTRTIVYTYDAEETLSVYAESQLRLSGDVPEAVLISSRALSLEGNIGINFYVNIPASFISGGGYALVNGSRKEIPSPETDGTYKFSCYVTAKEMHDDVLIKFCDRDGNTYPLQEREGVPVTNPDGYAFSVADYCEIARQLIIDPALLDLLDRMEEYGTYAQLLFNYETDQVSITQTMEDLLDEVFISNVAAYSPTISMTPDTGIEYAGATLVLETETSIRQYFRVGAGHQISEYRFEVGDSPAEPVFVNGEYYVGVTNILSNALDNPYSVTVRNANDSVIGTVSNYSALSYVYRVLELNGNNNQNLVNLVKGLYLYNQAANNYFG